MSEKVDILAIASYGGHFTELRMLEDAFGGRSFRYVTTRTFKDALVVTDLNINQVHLIPIVLFQLLKILIRCKPSCVITTGAAPGFLGLVLAKCLGIKTVWIDSVANIKVLSLSGRLAKPFSSKVYSQWKHLADSKVEFIGSLL